MKQMIKDALILFAITVVAGLFLGIVYKVTEVPIAQQAEKTKAKACLEVFADASSFLDAEGFDAQAASAIVHGQYDKTDIDNLQVAQDGSGNTLGYVITVTNHEGFGGDIQFMLGIRNDGTLNGMSILKISETAGLGMKADSVLKPQFAGKQVSQFKYTKTGAAADDEIDAISSATITTNAVTNGVNAGLYYFQNALEGGQ